MAAQTWELADEREVIPDLEFARVENEPLLLDLYRPAGTTGPLPVLVWVHGGGWVRGTRKKNFRPLQFVPLGCAAACLSYRFAPRWSFPAQIEDCRAAVRWLRAHAEQFELDPERFAALGRSAGGPLAGLLGLTPDRHDWDGVGEHQDQSTAMRAVVMFNSSGDFSRKQTPSEHLRAFLGCTEEDYREKAAAASPITYIHPGAPPFFLLHGDEDHLIRPLEAISRFHEKLLSVEVESTLMVLEGQGHACWSDEAAERIAEFLTRHLVL